MLLYDFLNEVNFVQVWMIFRNLIIYKWNYWGHKENETITVKKEIANAFKENLPYKCLRVLSQTKFCIILRFGGVQDVLN